MADGSSVISESRRASIKSRDGGLCVLCGMDPVEVAHIVARKSADHRRVVSWPAFVNGWNLYATP